jgi:hypothetical protein
MRFNEILTESRKRLTEAVGRDLQHIEDNMIVDGSAGAIESLEDLKGLAANAGSSSVKWDGTMAIYWGHDQSGKFYLIPNAQWAKKLVADKAGLAKEIQSTGRKRPEQSDDDFMANRKALAGKYLKLWDVFEKASQGTAGFFKGDIMFADPQQPDASGNYVFTPNKVTYTVSPKGLYGKMPTAQVFVTVHGKAEELGSSSLSPADPQEVAKLNSTPALIALDIQRPQGGLAINTKPIDTVINVVKKNANAIDSVANFSAPKFTTLKQVLYNYAVKLGKSHDKLDFETWLDSSKTSENQKSVIRELQKKPEWNSFWQVFNAIKKVKHDIFTELTNQHGGAMGKNLGIVSSTSGKPGGEGYVIPTGKIVNPYFRSAPDNPRFTGEI